MSVIKIGKLEFERINDNKNILKAKIILNNNRGQQKILY